MARHVIPNRKNSPMRHFTSVNDLGDIQAAVKEALESLSLKFSLKPDEAGMLRFLFGEEMTCPLRTETKCLDAFKKEIASDLRKKEDD